MNSNSVSGSDNTVAGRDIHIERYYERYKETASRLEDSESIFSKVDAEFRSISPNGMLARNGQYVIFKSEKLFTSLVSIGIPVSVALDAPSRVIPIMRTIIDNALDEHTITTSDIKAAVLQSLTGLHYDHKSIGEEETVTWCSAYVRRYGNANKFVQIIDYGKEHDLSYKYIKEDFLPHVVGSILGLDKGFDIFDEYKDVFSVKTLELMAKEVMKIANTLDVYSIRYKTFYHLVIDVILQPPHPWMVSEATLQQVKDYNIERSRYHFNNIASKNAMLHSAHFLPSAQECASHTAATILSYYGCLLGIESRYGLSELIRICDLKLDSKNLIMWKFCQFNRLEADLKRSNMSLRTFSKFLHHVNNSLRLGSNPVQDFEKAVANCKRLINYAEAIIGENIIIRT